jgi:hypothetical protein
MYRPYPHYAYRAGFRAGYRNGYWSSPRATPYTRGGGQVNINRNIYNRSTNIQRNVSRGQLARPAQKPRIATGQQNNVFTDRNGNVHRRTDSGWQQREGNKWSQTQRATPKQPAVKKQPVSSKPSNLNRQFKARQRGTTRTNQFRGRTGGIRGRR